MRVPFVAILLQAQVLRNRNSFNQSLESSSDLLGSEDLDSGNSCKSACLHCGDGRSFFVERYDDEDTAGNDCKSVYFESETGVNRALLKTLGGERGDR